LFAITVIIYITNPGRFTAHYGGIEFFIGRTGAGGTITELGSIALTSGGAAQGSIRGYSIRRTETGYAVACLSHITGASCLTTDEVLGGYDIIGTGVGTA